VLLAVPAKHRTHGAHVVAVPGYEKFMLPILSLASDGSEHTFGDAIEEVSDRLELSQEDRAVMLPSGTQTQVYNRFCWAITYLQKSKLLEKTARGRFRIATRGLEVLTENPPEINNTLLSRYTEFNQFKSFRRKADPEPNLGDTNGEDRATPEERLEAAHQELRNSLAAELLERVSTCSPKFFEHLVIDLLVAMGYGGSRSDAAQVVGKSGDGGIDGTIKEDKLGLDVIYVQAKRWEGTVGRKEVQSFAGSLEGERANKGVFITTSTFSAEAKDYVKRIGKKVVLIDGNDLSQLMIDHGIGCTEVKRYIVSKPDSDYFEGTM
jgi:restriction system protein